MLNQGRCLSFPISASAKGSFQTIGRIDEIVEQSIISIIETRQGERVMLPDYGLPDFCFDVMDAGFAARIAFFVAQQVGRYEPLAGNVTAQAGVTNTAGGFVPNTLAAAQKAVIRVTYTIAGQASPRNLVYPVWQLAPGN
ncbi:MAG TPA: GPW/gp25 family protein [Blastocatellia bacterium]